MSEYEGRAGLVQRNSAHTPRLYVWDKGCAWGPVQQVVASGSAQGAAMCLPLFTCMLVQVRVLGVDR